MSEVEHVSIGGLKVAKILHDFIVGEVIPGTGIEALAFWQGLERILHLFAPLNHALLQRRDALQAKIDDWYRGRRGRPFDEAAHRTFLEEIGYLVPEGPPFAVDTANVDDEIAVVAGPQLVVPTFVLIRSKAVRLLSVSTTAPRPRLRIRSNCAAIAAVRTRPKPFCW
jgi:malate synthase